MVDRRSDLDSVLKCAKRVPKVRNLSFMYSLDTDFEQFETLLE